MFKLLSLFATISWVLPSCIARSGVDLSVQADEATWSCLQKEGISYGIVRAYRSLGAIDLNAASTIKSAANVGMKDIGAYIFPCVSTSSYAVGHSILCDSPQKQVEDVLNYFASNNITFPSSKQSGKADNFITLNRMWIDIEDEDPSIYYDTDKEVNQAFLADLVLALEINNIPVGIYTTKTYWEKIMASNPNYGKYPLWYPRYDNDPSLDFFAPFAGWTEVKIKQIAGDAPLCSLSQVDLDFSLD